MPATRQNFLCSMVFAAGMSSALPALATATDARPGVTPNPLLQCRASLGARDIEWTIELDDALPLAIVDNLDTPAEYSDRHVRVRLAASGPNLFIGLASGRLLVTAVDGQTLGKGICKPLVSIATGNVVPITTLSSPSRSFRLTPARPAGTVFTT